jgi:hypothetical protein
MYSFDDINGDGLDDMVVHILTEGLEPTRTTESAGLAGRTLSGTRIFGTDSVQVKE